jgi:hypothetical protein
MAALGAEKQSGIANNDNQISRDELRSATQILVQQFRAMHVPEPAYSLSNTIRREAANPVMPIQTPAGTVPPAAVAPSPGAPPQR